MKYLIGDVAKDREGKEESSIELRHPITVVFLSYTTE